MLSFIVLATITSVLIISIVLNSFANRFLENFAKFSKADQAWQHVGT